YGIRYRTVTGVQTCALPIFLSGDNAIVIAMATKRLPKDQQNTAIIIGTSGAVILRVILAMIVVYLLQIPFVHLFGGALLLFIAYNVLVEKRTRSPLYHLTD